jgi:dienelactone hydrolase
MARKDLTFDSSGVNCAAWLHLPDTAAPHPVVVMAHGFAGVRQLRLDAYAERFAAAGMAVLLFDYRRFGASDGEPRQVLVISDQLDDWRAAVAFARSLPEIDHSRVAVWGTSLSGGHVLAIAADDHGLAACVSQNPHTDGVVTLFAIPPLQVVRLIAAGLRDQARKLTGRKPYRIGVVVAPGELAAMTTPDAEPGYRALVPAGFAWNDTVAARVALTISFYSPGRKAARIRCPVMFCVADNDAIAPPAPALKAAARTVDAELRQYPVGHFDMYVGEVFETVVADQLDSLQRQLIPAPGGSRKVPAVSQA